jgi:hypothetical protein
MRTHSVSIAATGAAAPASLIKAGARRVAKMKRRRNEKEDATAAPMSDTRHYVAVS